MVKKTSDMNKWILGDKRRLVSHYGKVEQSWLGPRTHGWDLDSYGFCAVCGGKVLDRELKAYGGNCGSCAGF